MEHHFTFSSPMYSNATAQRVRRRVRRAIALAVVGCAVVAAAGSPAAGGPLPDPVVAVDGNLLANPSFEAADPSGHPQSWVLGADPSATGATVNSLVTADQNVHTGKTSLTVVDPTDNNISVRSADVTAQPRVSYTAKAWVKNKSGSSAWFYLEFWDAARAKISDAVAKPAASSSWQQVSLTATAPAGTVHVTVLIYGTVTAGTGGTSWWDDASLTAAQVTALNPALGPARELFLDDKRIESATNVGRKPHPADKRGAPVIVADKAWESTVYIYGSVITGSGTGPAYKMYYTAYNNALGKYLLCYATSTDGLSWTKPNLGRYPFNNSTANNIVRDGGGTVLFDPDPADAKPYKLMTYVGDPQGYYAYSSANETDFTAVSSSPALPYGDVSNVSYDPVKKQFIATTKQRMLIGVTPGTNDRAAFVSTSPDFVTWSTPRMAVEGDTADTGRAIGNGFIDSQIYGMPVYQYESTYVGFPWVFDIDNSTSSAAGGGPIEPQLATSRDLIQWSRPVRTPVLPLGQEGAWDDSMIFTSTTLQVSSDKVTVYYGGFNVGHAGGAGQKASIGLASWRRDGFVSMHNAGDDAGAVVTKAVTFTGGTMHVNAAVPTGGSLRVEILDASTGSPITGFSATGVSGDATDLPVQWTGGVALSTLAGRPVKLKFSLDGSDLYSYWFN
jgi:hypothetical protein